VIVSESSQRVVPVVIRGQRYPIRSDLDERYIAELAAYVDKKVQQAEEKTPTSDWVRIAVLAALSIADEFFRARESERIWPEVVAERVGHIERILDEALAAREIPSATPPRHV
jgi:cell division protein ZapA